MMRLLLVLSLATLSIAQFNTLYAEDDNSEKNTTNDKSTAKEKSSSDKLAKVTQSTLHKMTKK